MKFVVVITVLAVLSIPATPQASTPVPKDSEGCNDLIAGIASDQFLDFFNALQNEHSLNLKEAEKSILWQFVTSKPSSATQDPVNFSQQQIHTAINSLFPASRTKIIDATPTSPESLPAQELVPLIRQKIKTLLETGEMSLREKFALTLLQDLSLIPPDYKTKATNLFFEKESLLKLILELSRIGPTPTITPKPLCLSIPDNLILWSYSANLKNDPLNSDVLTFHNLIFAEAMTLQSPLSPKIINHHLARYPTQKNLALVINLALHEPTYAGMRTEALFRMVDVNFLIKEKSISAFQISDIQALRDLDEIKQFYTRIQDDPTTPLLPDDYFFIPRITSLLRMIFKRNYHDKPETLERLYLASQSDDFDFFLRHLRELNLEKIISSSDDGPLLFFLLLESNSQRSHDFLTQLKSIPSIVYNEPYIARIKNYFESPESITSRNDPGSRFFILSHLIRLLPRGGIQPEWKSILYQTFNQAKKDNPSLALSAGVIAKLAQ